ncbi:uncharacterized protein LOC136073855 isoform X2 [Hydra vulgaris]|uniref:uncharacterized protein LOC136073855 isoform X2 n=1 Tax=Hydra vulgaris TaxID=6087 RepID=UPI0032E9F77E
MNSAIMRDLADYITTSDVKKLKMFLEIPYGIREKIKDGLDLMEYLQFKDFVYQNYEYNTNEAKIKLILNLLNEIGRKDIYKKFIVKFENPPSYEESVNPPLYTEKWKYTGAMKKNQFNNILNELHEFDLMKRNKLKEWNYNYDVVFNLITNVETWSLQDLCKRKLAYEKLLNTVIPNLQKQINDLLHTFLDGNEKLLFYHHIFINDCFDRIINNINNAKDNQFHLFYKKHYLFVQKLIIHYVYRFFEQTYFMFRYKTKQDELIMSSLFNIYMQCIDWLIEQCKFVYDPHFKPCYIYKYDFI